jgi:hypothetical protein
VGLDVYVGSLTRYYVEAPADVVERIARHQGVPAGNGQDAEEVIRAAVVRWRDGLSRWLGDRLAGPLDWDESGPAPCCTDKPGWDEFTVHTRGITGEEVELGSSVALLDQLELLSARHRLDAQPLEPVADGHSLSAAAGNGLAMLLRLAERSVINRVPMILDF